MIPVVYIAGPFRAGNNQWLQHQKIRRAEEVALEVWKSGCAALCPHLNTIHFQGSLPDNIWLHGDLAMLHRCDAVVMVNGWENSEGSKGEMEYAIKHNIPVFYESDWEPFLAWAEHQMGAIDPRLEIEVSYD